MDKVVKKWINMSKAALFTILTTVVQLFNFANRKKYLKLGQLSSTNYF